MLDLTVAVFPIALLVYLMTKRNGMPASRALPLVALVLYLVQLVYFRSDPNTVHATVAAGLLTAWTPILIVFGAIVLFRTMEVSGAMNTIRNWLNTVTDNRVAQLMIVGWAFSFLIEGASGFGTPVALAGPVLVGLGIEPVRAAILCLVMNSIPVSFGAVGTPTWFGFSELALSSADMLEVGFRTSLLHGAASLVVPVLALLFVVPWSQVRKNIGYVYLSVLACVVPYIILARIDYEFPAIAGGLIGLAVSVAAAKAGFGLERSEAREWPAPVALRALVSAAFPLWGTVLLLVATRVKQLGLKLLLTNATPFLRVPLGSAGTATVSPGLVVGVEGIFQTSVGWQHQLLYVPSFVPFIAVSALAFMLFRMDRPAVREVFAGAATQMRNPVLALLGSLVFVKLLMMGGDRSCTMIIGQSLASAIGMQWQFAAPFLGALGAFFSGSNTVSNLTFGGIQNAIAHSTGLDRITVLALQSAGGAMGNMVCIHNIVAVCSVLGLGAHEGYILKRTVWTMLAYGVVVSLAGLLL